MSERFSWKQMPVYYHASYYNDDDLLENRTFVIIDNQTRKEYHFPRIEIKKDCLGNEKRINILEEALWNQEFFNWICSTAPDFCINIPEEFMTKDLVDICIENSSKASFINKVPNPSQEQCRRFIERHPSAITKIPYKYITEEMITSSTEKNPELLLKIPKLLIPKKIAKKCYRKVDLQTKKKFIEYGCMNNLITEEMLRELVENEVAFENTTSTSNFWVNIPEEIITSDIALKMFFADSEYISIIPEKFLTKNMCKEAVTNNGKIIAKIPLKFQSLEVQKISIDQDTINISLIPRDALSDDIIIYTVNKNGKAVGSIPVERRTKPICQKAFNNNIKALRHIPNNQKDYQMCLAAVSKEPYLIRYVPVNILTREFFNELKQNNIIIPNKYHAYVKECFSHHDEMEKIANNNFQAPETNSKLDLKEITHTDLALYFTSASLKQIAKYINNLEQLFALSKRPDFIGYFNTSRVYIEVINTIRLLRCKYLNEDPSIDIENTELPLDELYKKLGLSSRSSNTLKRANFCKNPKEFFNKIKETSQEDLLRFRGLGKNTAIEIKIKADIVIDYYEKQKMEPNEYLKSELQRLKDERKAIDDQIDYTLTLMEEKNCDHSVPKSYVLKWVNKNLNQKSL